MQCSTERTFRNAKSLCFTPILCENIFLQAGFSLNNTHPIMELRIKVSKCQRLLSSRLCRLKKKAQGEVNATAISNLLPFMEYELHTQLMNKLKLRSMNALFGLRIQISIGENMLLGLAVG